MDSDARQVANWFVRRFDMDDRPLSVMDLMRLTYISHGWHLEMHGEPLFHNRIEAWCHGPVIPAVYDAFRSQGISVRRQVPGQPLPTNEKVLSLLKQVYDIYGSYEGRQLSDLTHIAGGPWDVTMAIGGPFHPIPDSVIKQHYKEKRANSQSAQAHG